MIKYSFIVPAYNEEKALPLFYERAVPVFERLDGDFEVIFINDGSNDKTEEVISRLSEKDARIKGVSFSRNFGQQSALLCGLSHASGDAVVAMDADLQDPPEVALTLIEKWKEGYDIVHARHKKRAGENVFKRFTAFLYYRTLNRWTNLNIPLDCGDFKLFDRKAVDAVTHMDEHTRLLRAQTAWIGFRQTVVEFDRPSRVAGETKYTLQKMIDLAKSGIVPDSRKILNFPLKAGIGALILSLAGFITLIVLTALGIEHGGLTAWIFPSLALVVGILSVNTGLQNLYLSEIYKECRNRPHYIVRTRYNLTEEAEKKDGEKD